jgi:hypothetical protein
MIYSIDVLAPSEWMEKFNPGISGKFSAIWGSEKNGMLCGILTVRLCFTGGHYNSFFTKIPHTIHGP